ncbi:C40 family peptidase [Paenibacillus montanisoli]|uniref:NlpC/P60 domain-containing protein n=1 Tax=Paenibacillus montanisoli TaxID=2081970 RepID=A0A328U5M3_9BACL|nr:C40 family peptidase [Paenibacillus montanisoli]RAP76741.1 hypothetical protein DL346_15475 [Paenibacillus montanisoli]
MTKRFPIFILLALLLASCSITNDNSNKLKKTATGSIVNVKGHKLGIGQDKPKPIPTEYWMRDGKVWIPAERAAALYDYRYELEPKSRTASMGPMDPLFKLTADSKKAKVGDETVELRNAPRMMNDRLYVEISSLSQLWHTPIEWDGKINSVIVTPPKTEQPGQTISLGTSGSRLRTRNVVPDDGFAPLAMNRDSDWYKASAKASKIIEYGKKFMGVRYKFSAEPYKQSRRFDCSSFMQHIYNYVGIELPRTSKSQSKVGKLVARDELKPGDLIFFYTPGRYSSNKIVSHVGIYIGNNKVLQTYGDPGVTITELEGSWDQRYLWARRVL